MPQNDSADQTNPEHAGGTIKLGVAVSLEGPCDRDLVHELTVRLQEEIYQLPIDDLKASIGEAPLGARSGEAAASTAIVVALGRPLVTQFFHTLEAWIKRQDRRARLTISYEDSKIEIEGDTKLISQLLDSHFAQKLAKPRSPKVTPRAS